MEFWTLRIRKLNTELHSQRVQMTVPIYSQHRTTCVYKLSPTFRSAKFIIILANSKGQKCYRDLFCISLWLKLSIFSCY